MIIYSIYTIKKYREIEMKINYLIKIRKKIINELFNIKLYIIYLLNF